jgi:hypothetical protein
MPLRLHKLRSRLSKVFSNITATVVVESEGPKLIEAANGHDSDPVLSAIHPHNLHT